jgi:hypothetical protein
MKDPGVSPPEVTLEEEEKHVGSGMEMSITKDPEPKGPTLLWQEAEWLAKAIPMPSVSCMTAWSTD